VELDKDSNFEFRRSKEIARIWLEEMQACVRAVDYARCGAIVADDVVGFGSKATMVVGKAALEEEQWRQVWPNIRNFTFLVDQMHCGSGGVAVVWICCPCASERRDADGCWVARPGRMTTVLERRGDAWLAVHTHHSEAPVLHI